jgi:hypothetical protein
LKRTLSLARMLNVFQLMTALLVDWLTITAGPPWPWMVAAPPTTDAPSGPAAAGVNPRARSVAEATIRLRKHAFIATFYQTMKKTVCFIAEPSISRCDALRHKQASSLKATIVSVRGTAWREKSRQGVWLVGCRGARTAGPVTAVGGRRYRPASAGHRPKARQGEGSALRLASVALRCATAILRWNLDRCIRVPCREVNARTTG